MTKTQERTQLLLRYDIPTDEFIGYIAKTNGTTKNGYVRDLLENHVQDEIENMTEQEIDYVMSNVKVAEARRKLKEAEQMDALVKQWSGREQ